MTIGPGAVVNNRYQLERQIGAGGMATVWLADDRLLGRKVAVKVLADRYAADPGFVERFRREASAAASLSHQNIVAVYDRGEAAGSYYIVMEYLPGPDLKAIIRQHGRLEPRHAVDAALQILAALGAAHRRDVIHRDIKPQNVLVSEDGQLKVTDFGIARAGGEAEMTDHGSVIGTAQYLSPEQARGADVTTASDCYSVGVVLYEMLTGKVPFDGDKPVAIAMRQVNEPPIAPKLLVPTIPDALNAVVMKSLEKRPSTRYRTAEEFTQALLAVRPTLPSPDQRTQIIPPVEQPTQMLPPAPRVDPPTERATRTSVQSRPATPPPAPVKRRRTGMIVAILLTALVLAGAVAAALFTDVGRQSQVAIPSVIGQTEAEATAMLSKDFTVRSETRANETYLAGQVIGTDPEAGTRVAKGSDVTLLVSSGPATADVPDVVGKTEAEATATLKQAGFTVAPSEQFSADAPKGEVVSQTPAGNATAPSGSAVKIVVSKGPDLVTVPSLSLMTEAEAKSALEKKGLKLGKKSTRESTKRDPGLILDQDPKAGQKVPRDSAVDYTVSVAPTTTTTTPTTNTIPMPNVVGLSSDLAISKLTGFGFATPTSNTAASDTVPSGQVIQQFPTAGTQVDPETEIPNIVVSTGPATTNP